MENIFNFEDFDEFCETNLRSDYINRIEVDIRHWTVKM